MTTEKLAPLPVAGYQPQSEDNVEMVNVNKQLEEVILLRFDLLAQLPEIDKRWLAIARTNIEQGFMAANRAIFKPARINLES